MNSFFDKMLGIINEPQPLEGEDEFDVQAEVAEDVTYGRRPEQEREEKRRGNKVVAMPEKPALAAVGGSGIPSKMIIFQPLCYDDAQTIVDNIKARKPVIVNMVDLERETAQRVIDFIAGATYALNGSICKVSYGIYLLAPNSVSVVGNKEETERDMFRS